MNRYQLFYSGRGYEEKGNGERAYSCSVCKGTGTADSITLDKDTSEIISTEQVDCFACNSMGVYYSKPAGNAYRGCDCITHEVEYLGDDLDLIDQGYLFKQCTSDAAWMIVDNETGRKHFTCPDHLEQHAADLGIDGPLSSPPASEYTEPFTRHPLAPDMQIAGLG